jgi:thiamine-phosphate pyrophosphorylase
MSLDKKDLLLYAVTNRSWLAGNNLYSQVEKAIRGGVTFVQLREKELPTTNILEEAKKIKKLCDKNQVPLVINDNVDMAIEIDADGVHVGQKDMEAGHARRLIGNNKILGVSAQTVEQAVLAEKNGADYLGVGAVFPTDSKVDAEDVAYESLKKICEAVSIPVVAIGGINKNNLHKLSGSGICGIAVISAIFAQTDIVKATATLKELTQKMINA